MKIKGSHALESTKEIIWKMLNDPEVLSEITPGISKLERIEGDNFMAISEIKIGPVRGSFEGKLSLEEKVEFEKMTVFLDQKSQMGNAKAKIGMNLVAIEDGKIEIRYEGDAKLSGRLASMGQRIVGGVINTLSKEFFTELEKEVSRRDGIEVPKTGKPSLWQRIIEFLKQIFKSN